MRKYWPKWIKLSIAQFVKQNNITNISLHVEGENRDAVDNPNEYIELRVDGPNIIQTDNRTFFLYTDINVAIVVASSPDNLVILEEHIGSILHILGHTIPIYKYGNTVADDKTLFGCATRQNEIRVTRFGTKNPTAIVTQAQVETQYRLEVTYNEYDTSLALTAELDQVEAGDIS